MLFDENSGKMVSFHFACFGSSATDASLDAPEYAWFCRGWSLAWWSASMTTLHEAWIYTSTHLCKPSPPTRGSCVGEVSVHSFGLAR